MAEKYEVVLKIEQDQITDLIPNSAQSENGGTNSLSQADIKPDVNELRVKTEKNDDDQTQDKKPDHSYYTVPKPPVPILPKPPPTGVFVVAAAAEKKLIVGAPPPTTNNAAEKETVGAPPPTVKSAVEKELVGACKFYKCLMCETEDRPRTFESYERIQFHLEIEHEMTTEKLRENLIECNHDEKQIHCRECGENFMNGALLYQHIQDHRATQTLDSILMATCLVCNHTCASVHGIHQHVLRTHFIVKPDERVKFIVGKLITAADKRSDEVTDCLFRTCRYCSKYFSTEKTLKNHLLSVHSDKVTPCDLNKKYQCVKCPSSFTSTFNLSKHVKMKHPSNRGRYICCICLEKFSANGPAEIREHYKMHKTPGSGEAGETMAKTTGARINAPNDASRSVEAGRPNPHHSEGTYPHFNILRDDSSDEEEPHRKRPRYDGHSYARAPVPRK